jgi:hypothetical protein
VEDAAIANRIIKTQIHPRPRQWFILFSTLLYFYIQIKLITPLPQPQFQLLR